MRSCDSNVDVLNAGLNTGMRSGLSALAAAGCGLQLTSVLLRGEWLSVMGVLWVVCRVIGNS